MKLKFAAVILSASLALAGCRAEQIELIQNQAYATPVSSSVQALTLDDYKNAILRAGVQRGWSFQDQGPGELVGTIVVRAKHTAKVRVLYDESAFSIVYIDSSNLNYDGDRSEIHPNYNHWVRNLRNDIQAQVSLARLG